MWGRSSIGPRANPPRLPSGAESSATAWIVAAASIHGVYLVTEADDSPHLNLVPGAEVYVACAETDEWAPPPMVEAYAAALSASPAPGRVEWYPGTKHGFSFRERGDDIYDKGAAERHWERLHELFRRRLHVV